MTAKPVARKGDVVATASLSTEFVENGATTATGKWTVVPPVSETLMTAAASGPSLVASATCGFLFTGTLKAGGGPFSKDSSVTLTAATHLLRVGTPAASPLVDGERHEDDYGNKLEVKSSATWRSA